MQMGCSSYITFSSVLSQRHGLDVLQHAFATIRWNSGHGSHVTQQHLFYIVDVVFAIELLVPNQVYCSLVFRHTYLACFVFHHLLKLLHVKFAVYDIPWLAVVLKSVSFELRSNLLENTFSYDLCEAVEGVYCDG
jgi:hypothetical protein